MGSNGVRFETCWYKSDNNTPAHVRAIQGHCSRPINCFPEFFKHIVEILHGWTYSIQHSSSQPYLEKILLHGLLAGGIGSEEGRQACYCSAAHSQQSKAVLDRKSLQPHIVPDVHHKWHTDTVYETDLLKAQDMSLTFLQTFSHPVVPFGDMPAECIARVVGKSNRTHQQSKQISLHRVTDCLTLINNKRCSISLGIVVIPCLKITYFNIIRKVRGGCTHSGVVK